MLSTVLKEYVMSRLPLILGPKESAATIEKGKHTPIDYGD